MKKQSQRKNRKDVKPFHVDQKIIQEASECINTCKTLSSPLEKVMCVFKQKKECEAYKKFTDVSDQCKKTKCKKQYNTYTKIFNSLAKDKSEKAKKKFESAANNLTKCNKKNCPTLE